jgi:hypothetical protein
MRQQPAADSARERTSAEWRPAEARCYHRGRFRFAEARMTAASWRAGSATGDANGWASRADAAPDSKQPGKSVTHLVTAGNLQAASGLARDLRAT